jgi:prefoldin subunit 5
MTVARIDEVGRTGSKRLSKIAELEAKLRQLKERQQSVEARRRTLEARRERKADTRRKILVGAIVLAKVEHGEMDRALLRRWLEHGLTRDDDRRLFGLAADGTST